MIQSETVPVASDGHSSTAASPDVPRVTAFEMQVGGHHPSYIRNIARLWAQRKLPAKIDFVVTPAFFEGHADVVAEVAAADPSRVRILSITEQEYEHIESGGWKREFRGWKTFCHYARQANADHGLLMYGDHFQLPMLFGQASPCPLSWIYFRPTFHYSQWPEHRSTWKQSLAAWRKKVLLQQCLKVKQLRNLFCLDEFVTGYIERHFSTRVKPLVLPDSFVRYETTPQRVDKLRSELGIDPGRRVFLSLGILDSRKGPIQLLDAALALPPESQAKLCLLLVGAIDPSIEADVLARLAQLRDATPAQVVARNEYVSDTFVQHYYELADVALTTYQRHMGMSSALMRAGLARIPVLSASYGLMGELVRRHQLGLTCETTDPESFTTGLQQAIDGSSETLFDADLATSFAQQHSPESLGDTLADWVSRVSRSCSCSRTA